MFVALFGQHMTRMRHIVLSSVTILSLLYISALSRKRHDFRGGKKVTKHKMCVLIFSTTLSEKFIVLRRIERDIIKNLRWSLCNVASFLSEFNQTQIFPTGFQKNLSNIKFHLNPSIESRVAPC